MKSYHFLSNIIEKLHSGHQDFINTMPTRYKDLVWWPGIKKDIEEKRFQYVLIALNTD